ncbi:MAG: redox-sensing transcriptional repressor Rex, partial [Aristaeellaceae bacterium]
GAGNIGGAVAKYPTFSREGFRTDAIFDNDPEKIGTAMGDVTIQPMDTLECYLQENTVDIAVLALPAAVAQATLDRLYTQGVRAVWNFAPTDLNHPEDMIVVNVHLSDSLQILSYRMAHREVQ